MSDFKIKIKTKHECRKLIKLELTHVTKAVIMTGILELSSLQILLVHTLYNFCEDSKHNIIT